MPCIPSYLKHHHTRIKQHRNHNILIISFSTGSLSLIYALKHVAIKKIKNMKLEKSLAYKYDREISMNDVCFICISELLLQTERALVEATCTLHCVLCTYLSAFTG